MCSSRLAASCSQTMVQNCSPVTSVITFAGGAPISFISGSICLNRFTISPTLPGLQYRISRIRYIRPPSALHRLEPRRSHAPSRVERRALPYVCAGRYLQRSAIRVRNGTAALGELRDLGELRGIGALQPIRRRLEFRRKNLDAGLALVGGDGRPHLRALDRD